MTDEQQNKISDLVQKAIPAGSLIFGLAAVLWSFSNTMGTNSATLSFQGTEIAKIIDVETGQQATLNTISTQLATLQQQIADIKANSERGGGP